MGGQREPGKRKPFAPAVVLLGAALVLAGALLWRANNQGMPEKTVELTQGAVPRPAQEGGLSESALAATADFSTELFQRIPSQGKNLLFSPPSVYMALGLTANGAAGETQEQMVQMLGGDAGIVSLNRTYHTLAKDFALEEEDAKVSLSSSLWLKSGLQVEPDFLKVNADDYGADVYTTPFDKGTVEDINAWVNGKTDGAIPKLLDTLNPSGQMVLVNTLLFDATWALPYGKSAVDGPFSLADGSQITAHFMSGVENLSLGDENATGFLKPYSGGAYSFLALLPKEGMSPEDYLSTLSAQKLEALLQNVHSEPVEAVIPKFSFSCSLSLKQELMELGMTDAFDSRAQFSNLSESPLYVDDVIQKTFIQVNELGTRAGAATAVAMNTLGAPAPEKQVVLNRPFLFAILDNQNHLPLFLGILQTPTD